MAETLIDTYLGQYRMKLSSDFSIDSYYLKHGRWEDPLRAYIEYFVRPGSICVDVGANVGFHTITMAHCCGADGRVFAFEPATSTFPRLVDNINLNPGLKPRVIAEKIGLSNSAGMLKLFASGELQGNAYMGQEYNEQLWNSGGPEDFELCIVTTLDDYLPAETALSFMKIDVEGMEIEVLQGARKCIEKHRPVIVYETLLESFDAVKIRACESFLADCGYYFFAFDLKSGKLKPVRMPLVYEDTLAIHSSQIGRYGDIFLNAAQFVLEPDQGMAFPVLEYTVIGLTPGIFSIATRPVSGTELELCTGRAEGGSVACETSAGDLNGRIELAIFDSSGTWQHGKAPVLEGRFISAEGLIPLRAHSRGGQLGR